MDSRPTGTVSVDEVIRNLRRDHYLRKREAAEYLGWSVRKLEGHCTHIRHYRHALGCRQTGIRSDRCGV